MRLILETRMYVFLTQTHHNVVSILKPVAILVYKGHMPIQYITANIHMHAIPMKYNAIYNIGSGNSLVLSGNKPLLEPKLTQISATIWRHYAIMRYKDYHQISNIRRTRVGNKIVHHSHAVGESPIGAAPTTSSFST